MNKKTALEITITVFITFLIALIAVGLSTLAVKDAAEKHYLSMPKAQNVREDSKLLISLIAKFEAQALKHPADYTLNTKLGNLYDILGDKEEAQKNFFKAAQKSPYNITSTWIDLVSFYIKTKNFNQAAGTIAKIKNQRNKTVRTAVGSLYINLGDAYCDFGDFEIAIQQYEKALSCYEYSKNTKLAQIAQTRILDAYEDLADKNIEKRKLTSAITSLEKSLKIKYSPFISYKLAILYKDVDPLTAYKYMRKTYDNDPGIINFDIYEKIIIDVTNYYKKKGLKVEQELYSHKLKVLKKFKERYIISRSDFEVQIISAKIRRHIFSDKKTFTIKFRIKNNSDKNVPLLYVQVDAKNNGENKVVFFKKLFSKKNPLRPLQETEPFTIRTTIDDSISAEYSNTIKFDFRVSKNYKVRSKLIDTFEITK